jgi:hypothetical protein
MADDLIYPTQEQIAERANAKYHERVRAEAQRDWRHAEHELLHELNPGQHIPHCPSPQDGLITEGALAGLPSLIPDDDDRDADDDEA